ncbi:MAG: PQQ-dependent sugar dehydrogenase [Bacteroidales bacterium]|nr:PQQ-dependent sugar dehydrogenase [Bacteroidales bacterium]
MRFLFLSFVFLLPAVSAAGDAGSQSLMSGLSHPRTVAVTPDGTKTYITVAGAPDKPGDGAVLLVSGGKTTPFLTGLTDPYGVAVLQDWVYAVDQDRVLRVGGKGAMHALFAPPNAFPTPPRKLHDITVDVRNGTAYVSDEGGPDGSGAAVYRITSGGQVSRVTDATLLPGLRRPTGLVLEGSAHLLIADSATGTIYRVNLATGNGEIIADRLGGVDGLAWDAHGRLFVTDRTGGKLFVIPRPGEKPVEVATGLASPACPAFDLANNRILVPCTESGTVASFTTDVPGQSVNRTPLAIETNLAFPNLKWTGWEPETVDGKANPLRPIVLTHAGDGSHRVFVATQHGVIHVFPNDPSTTATRVFLDLTNRVRYDDKSNEEGFLGLAFHPRFRENGEFFVFYTPQAEKGVNLVSRFRVRKGEPNQADPASEEVLLRFEKPFWNHDGGTIAFGPDGMLYVTHGDGGSGNDPYDNGQNLRSLLGKIHRIDVDKRDAGKAYAIPADNPFVKVPDARPEIWAYGFRNVWRMAFDTATGQLWAADVGQNLFEEINLVQKGGNYGWNRREGLHPFGARGTGPQTGLIDPIWEYHHDVGKSITGGTVYRGKRFPELAGAYIYGDYVSTKIWALRYDAGQKRVTENRPIPDRKRPILSFGQDQDGELYLLTTATDGRGIFRFDQKK